MSPNLRITLIQSNLGWESVDANLQAFTEKIEKINEPTDLVILPEMFSTGFSMQAPELAKQNDKAIEWMQDTAMRKNCAVTGSLIIEEPAGKRQSKFKYYNRLIWMMPGGEYLHYDKRHLFSLSSEEQVFTPGHERLIVEWKGWKICPLVCYDLRFPVWSRNSAENPYDLLIYVANWPERRVYAWKHLLVARAIENLAFVAGVNRVGNDGNDLYYSGDSMVLDAMGQLLYHKADGEDVATVELVYSDLQKIRETLPFLQDGDKFSLNTKQKIQAH